MTLIPIPEDWKKNARIKADDYARMYAESISDVEQFFGKEAEHFLWRKQWTKVKNTSFNISAVRGQQAEEPSAREAAPHVRAVGEHGGVIIRWFEGAKLNITENCIDRHLPERANQTAFIWEGDDPNQSRHITYQQLYDEVCAFANHLKSLGVKKGDRVTIYLPMIPEAAFAMLACARIAAVHSVVFAGFSAEALAGRITDCGSKLVITTAIGKRGGKEIPLRANVVAALKIVNDRSVTLLDISAPPAANHQLPTDCEAVSMDAEDPLFILYTSGSTGKPKGVLHTTAGYMVWVGRTFLYTFDYRDGDIFWCSADVGWVTGHSYCVYGPLLNGATSLLFEGVPNYPDASRFWQVIDKHKVSIFYTAPTAIRALMREGDAPVTQTSRKSLRLLGSVGEPINPEAWRWYYEVVGEKRCPVIDTWWQTETGGHMMTPLPGAHAMKPGSAAFPWFGVQPVIVDPQGNILEGECEGMLCIADSWPGQARTVYGDHTRFEETYFSQFAGLYFTGDGAKRDKDGYYWITGRVDDVLNVSGHRIGTAEVESALVGHANVTEAAVVGYPHDIKGQGIYCYVTLSAGVEGNEETIKDLKNHVRKVIGPIATPDVIHFTPALPKTRSGKIMRRILRKIAEGETENLGDISTLTNPEIVATLVAEKK